MVCSVPLVYGHADPMRMKLFQDGYQVNNIRVIGLEDTEDEDEEEPELMSYKWQQKYYIPIFSASIAATILATATVVYRQSD